MKKVHNLYLYKNNQYVYENDMITKLCTFFILLSFLESNYEFDKQ